MARPDRTKRRVSQLVGRFEQLASRPSSWDEEAMRPSSHHGETALSGRITDKRAFSVASPEAALQLKLAAERQRRREIEDECDRLRQRCRETEDSRTRMAKKLEQVNLARQGYEEQRKYMEGKMECLRQQMSSKIKTDKAEHDRADAEAEELREQLRLSEVTRHQERERAKEEILRHHNLLAVKLRDAEATAEAAVKNAHNLEKQLRELKQNMSKSTRVEKQVSDQEVTEKMGRLHHEVQNWVVNAFRRVKIESPKEMKRRFEKLPLLASSNLLRAAYSDFDTRNKLFFLQGTVLHLLMQVFEDDFFGLPNEFRNLQTTVAAVKTPTASYNEWRSQTFLFLQKADGDLKHTIESATRERSETLIESISDALSTLTVLELNKSQLTGLEKIVDYTVSIWRLLCAQRAEYRCVLPDAERDGQLNFDGELMEDIQDSTEKIDGQPVNCIVFPAVLKAGDEQGDNMHWINVIMRARVLCQHDDEDSDQADE